jgi:hypothetical protein
MIWARAVQLPPSISTSTIEAIKASTSFGTSATDTDESLSDPDEGEAPSLFSEAELREPKVNSDQIVTLFDDTTREPETILPRTDDTTDKDSVRQAEDEGLQQIHTQSPAVS